MFKSSSSSSSSILRFKPLLTRILELDLTNLQTTTYFEIISLIISLILINFLIFWISLRLIQFSFKPFTFTFTSTSTSSSSSSSSKIKRNSKLKLIKLQSIKSFKSNHHHHPSSTTCTTTTINNNNNNTYQHIINQIKSNITSFISIHSNQFKTWIKSYHSKLKSKLNNLSSPTSTTTSASASASTSTTSALASTTTAPTTSTQISPTPNLNTNSRKRKQKQKINPNSTLNSIKNQPSIKPKPILISIGTQTDDHHHHHHHLDSSPRSRTISLQTISEFHHHHHQESNQEPIKSLSNRRSKPNLTLDFLNSCRSSDSHLHQSFQSDQLTQSSFTQPTQSSINHFHPSTPSKPHSLSTPPSPLLNKSTLLNHQLGLTHSLSWTSPDSSSICHQSHTSSTSTRTFSTSTTSSHLDLCQCPLHPSESINPSTQKLPSKPILHSTHPDRSLITSQFEQRPSHLHLKGLSLGLDINRNQKDALNPVITSWKKLCEPSASSSDSSRSTHSTNTHPSVINTNEDSLDQDLPPTFSPTIPTHTFHESVPLDETRFGLIDSSQDLQPSLREKWPSHLTDPIEQSSVTTDDQDHSNLFVTHPQLTHSPAALSSILPLSPSSSLPPTGSQSSEALSSSSHPIQDSTNDSPDQAPLTTPYLFQSSLHSPTHAFHPHPHHHPATRSVSNPNRSHSSLPLPSLIPPTPPSCTPHHLPQLISAAHPGLSLPPSPLPTPQSSQLYQHPLPSRSSFTGPPPFSYGPNGYHPNMIGSASSSGYSSGTGYPTNFFNSPSPYSHFSNGNTLRSTSQGSPQLTPFYGGLYYHPSTPSQHKKQTHSKRRTSTTHQPTAPNQNVKPPRMENEENEMERLKNRLKGLRSKLREVELENCRKERELEIARWRLECVGVEKCLEEIETQKAIHHFLERAERSESYLKVLESKLNSNQVSSVPTLVNKAKENDEFLRSDRDLEMDLRLGLGFLDKGLDGIGIGIGLESGEKNIGLDEDRIGKDMKGADDGDDLNDVDGNGNGKVIDQDQKQDQTQDQEQDQNEDQNQKKWQIVDEFDFNQLEIDFDD